jgi:hypothetical protein
MTKRLTHYELVQIHYRDRVYALRVGEAELAREAAIAVVHLMRLQSRVHRARVAREARVDRASIQSVA